MNIPTPSVASASRLKSAVELTASILTIATCLAVLAFLGTRFFNQTQTTASQMPAAGLRLDPVGEVRFDEADRTILVGLSTKCRYCEQSIPALRELIAGVRASPQRVKVIAVGAEPVDALRDYLSRNGVTPHGVESAQGPLTKQTPTLAVVDNQGRVLGGWIGVVDEERRKQVLKAVGG
jgi:hypothetical protein